MTVYSHRLHYRWSQLEADRCGFNIGSPVRPLPTTCRTLLLNCNCYDYELGSLTTADCESEQTKFSGCAAIYKDIDYNTFCKNGALKLTEVELFFLSSKMSRKTSCEWAVVYLGVGTGERFRFLRDEFFPELTVIAFDPLEGNFTGDREQTVKNAHRWNDDGTHFTFAMRCFTESECDWVREKASGKKMLLISDIRGMHFKSKACAKHVFESKDYDQTFDKDYDQQLQLQAIRMLCPESSLVKFSCPYANEQFYDYAPGVLLKQAFCWYGTRELRLMIDGSPQETKKYSVWEIYEKMRFHHENLRGQVYESSRHADVAKCLDNCFDCSVLWDTVSTYARQNDMKAEDVLLRVIGYHIYSPSDENHNYTWAPPTLKQRREDVQECLRRGNLMQAIAALEAQGKDDEGEMDWVDIVPKVADIQPLLGHRLRSSLHRPTARKTLIEVLGSLSDPLTLVQTDIPVTLSRYEQHMVSRSCGEPPKKRRRSVWDSRFEDLTESQKKAAVALGWTEKTWNASTFELPRKGLWSSLANETQCLLTELGECEESWNAWKPVSLN